MNLDQRQFIRIAVNVPTALVLLQIQAYHSGHIANISMGGCFFAGGEDLPIGEECQITITVGEGIETAQITLNGLIVRSDSHGAGIQFINAADQQLLLAHIIARSALASPPATPALPPA